MKTLNDVHQQFAEFFKSDTLKPYAYLVSKKLSEGHICIHVDEAAEELNETGYFEKPADTGYLLREQLVTTKDGIKQPFVLHKNKLYLQRYFSYETIILDRIKGFIHAEKELLAERLSVLEAHNQLIKFLFSPAGSSNEDKKEPDWQLAAAITAVLKNFTIITGGPGTGKTTTVAKILAILFTINPVLKVALAAPTGKAAARMADSLKGTSLDLEEPVIKKFHELVPSTLHRLLKNEPGFTSCRYNKSNPLHYDVVIVDEASMIDVSLFAKLFDAIGPETRLILLGDKDQLASVEAGSLFGDLCNAQPALNLFFPQTATYINSFNSSAQPIEGSLVKEEFVHPLFEHVVELRHSHRFSGNKGIGLFSKAVIDNDEKTIEHFISIKTNEQVIIDTDYREYFFASFVKGYEGYIKEPDITNALRKLNNVRVLCAVREGDQGLFTINRRIEKLLQQKGLISAVGEFYENRPVMILRNLYELQLFNGDVGLIRPDETGTMKAWFLDSEGKLKSVLPGFIGESETVFAMTIHKSQGSEFDNVMVVLPDTPDIALLTRELLYTAITRAKKEVVIQGTREIIMETAQRKVKRVSGIIERFIED